MPGNRCGIADLQYGVMCSNMYLPSAARNNIDIQISCGWHKIFEWEEKKKVEEVDQPKFSSRQELKMFLSMIDVGEEEIKDVGRRFYGNFRFGSMSQIYMVYDTLHSVKDLMVISRMEWGKRPISCRY